MDEELKKIEQCFDRLQNLMVKSTMDNMEIILQTLYDLRDVHKMLREGDNGGGNETDSE